MKKTGREADMIIDFHTHIFPDAIAERTIDLLYKSCKIPPSTNGTVSGLLQSMERSGVDMSVILPVVTKPSQFQSINAFAQSINEKYAGRLISFGGIHPDSEDYKKELRTIKEMGLPGIKLHPEYQNTMIDDVRYMNIIEYASELGLIISTHAGKDSAFTESVHCPPDKMRKVIDTIRPEKFIVAHYGGWKRWEMVYEYLAGADVYLDTSVTLPYIEQDLFLKIWEKHDKKKLLFATDSPWDNAVTAVEAFRALPISGEEKAAVFGGNAKRLLGLE